jgi:hypothetical protein
MWKYRLFLTTSKELPGYTWTQIRRCLLVRFLSWTELKLLITIPSKWFLKNNSHREVPVATLKNMTYGVLIGNVFVKCLLAEWNNFSKLNSGWKQLGNYVHECLKNKFILNEALKCTYLWCLIFKMLKSLGIMN